MVANPARSLGIKQTGFEWSRCIFTSVFPGIYVSILYYLRLFSFMFTSVFFDIYVCILWYSSLEPFNKSCFKKSVQHSTNLIAFCCTGSTSLQKVIPGLFFFLCGNLYFVREVHIKGGKHFDHNITM